MVDAPVLAELMKMTSFTQEEVNVLYSNFKKLCAHSQTRRGGGTGPGLLDKEEFRRMMMVTNDNSTFINALFKLFDTDANGNIDFREFVIAVAIYQGKARSVSDDDKHRLFYKFYDADGDGEISKSDIETTLRSCFEASFMRVSDDDIRALVRTTFEKYSLTPRETIDFGAFSAAATAKGM